MLSRELAIIIAAIMISFSVALGLVFQAHEALAQVHCRPPEQARRAYRDGGLAVSGTNIYAAWTCFSNVFFTGSHDGGKTFANTMLVSSSLNTNPKTFVLNDNVSIGASGNNVAIMWDTNKTGGMSTVISKARTQIYSHDLAVMVLKSHL